ncbi:bilirubin oxidase [Pyrenophora seminiperda CCB06]|uniref:Bilirubin oxidase n=1 Tax=Pyrenophora seminiperda CCB06 TaxID=1302712 RepID=A0A3M7M7J5_9PLEO|nr:bilirubin oxidase [Pyrenophora seminiperda CCB06]
MFFSTVTRLSVLLSCLLISSHAAPFPPDTLPPNNQTSKWVSPVYKWIFENPLPIPPVKTPKFTYTNNDTGAVIDYYEVEVTAIEKQVYPDLPPTDLYAYDGVQPGPTFMMQRGRLHVHGQYNRAPFDGWAADYALPGQYKDYYYPNAQNARTIWYHDHTEYQTAKNVYRGLDGFYIISDEEEQALNLPAGDYDIPLSLSAKRYATDGSLIDEDGEHIGLWGDVIQVNGQPWPFLNVEPRKYRFRVLNGAVSRAFNLFIIEDNCNKTIDFDIIASDGGLFSHPVNADHFALSNGERYEIIFDFASYAGKNLTMLNERGMAGNLDFAATDRVMRFVVGDQMTNSTNNGDIPQDLRYIPPAPVTNVTKNFTFSRIDGEWVINGVGWVDIENRILTRPVLGEDEIWELRHGGGNASHPVHIHLVDFQVLSREGGRNMVLPYEAAGMKDVVWIAPGEVVRVVARYAPWKGVYMFHCHNLIHEDHDMLTAFNVTQLDKWGYDNTTIFIDPMEPRFRPKDVNTEDYTEEAIEKKLDWFYSLDAYNQTSEWETNS